MDSYLNQIDFSRWRRWLYRICTIFVAIIILLELLFFVMVRFTGLLTKTNMSLIGYGIRFFFVPAALLVLILLISKRLITSKTVSEKKKNDTSAFTFWAICTVVECTHYVFTPVLCASCIAIFMTALFGDQKLTKRIFICSILTFCVAVILAYTEVPQEKIYFSFDMIVVFTMIVSSYLAAKTLSLFERQRAKFIYESYREQYAMNKKIRLEPMTGLLNRKVFIQNVESAITRRKRDKLPLYVAMIDLDDFKKINDTYGHVHGDEVLMRLTELINHYTPVGCLAGRYGGEEFILLFHDLPRNKALQTVENIRKELENQRFDFASDKHITLSCGICDYADESWDSTKFIEKADQNLYRAKERGKNNVVHSFSS